MYDEMLKILGGGEVCLLQKRNVFNLFNTTEPPDLDIVIMTRREKGFALRIIDYMIHAI